MGCGGRGLAVNSATGTADTVQRPFDSSPSQSPFSLHLFSSSRTAVLHQAVDDTPSYQLAFLPASLS